MARSSKKPSKRGPNQKKRPFKKASFKPRKQQQKEEQSDGSSEAEAGDFEDILSRIRGLNSDDSDQDIDDDEELDSDLADTDGEDGPGESQKQRSRAPAKKSGQAEIDLNEDSDGPEEDNTGDGMVDLSTMLDLQPQESPEDSDSDQLSQDSDENGTEDDDEALDKLNAFISSLPTDQQAQLAESSGGKKRKLAERTESQPENEFATVGGHKKLRLEDMLSTLPAGQAKSMKKSLKPLITSKDSQNAGPLPAPLDSRSQAKLDRQAAREKLSGEVDKWNTTVSQSMYSISPSRISSVALTILAIVKGIGSKTSDLGTHRITLPLNAPDLKTAPSAAELGSQFHVSC